MENYRQSSLSRLVSWGLSLGYLLLHPTTAWRSSTLWNKVNLFFCYVLSYISVGYHEKKTLIEWVKTRVKNYPVPDNFSSGWKDGILLCALLDSMYPGSCPRYDLLHADNSVSNAQLAFFLLEKHTPIRPEITAEELAEGNPSIEKAVRMIVSRLKQISAKTQLQRALGKRPSIKEDTDDSSSLVAKQNCFAKGMGLILAVRGRKATFNIFTRSTSNFCIVVEIRGPDNSVCKELITNKSPRKKVMSSSNNDDSVDDDQQEKKILIEYDIQPGRLAVKYTPVIKGKHQLSVIWHGQHVSGSPFTVNVDDSTDYVDDAFLQRQDSTESQSSEKDDKPSVVAVPAIQGQLKGRVRRRRVLRRIVNVNGQDIVIEGDDPEKLQEVLRSTSKNVLRQTSTDLSLNKDKRSHAAEATRFSKPYCFSPISSPESSPETYSQAGYEHKPLWDASMYPPSKLAAPEIVVSSFGQQKYATKNPAVKKDYRRSVSPARLQRSGETENSEAAASTRPCIHVEDLSTQDDGCTEQENKTDPSYFKSNLPELELTRSIPIIVSPEESEDLPCQSSTPPIAVATSASVDDKKSCPAAVLPGDISCRDDTAAELTHETAEQTEDSRKLSRMLSIISEENDRALAEPAVPSNVVEMVTVKPTEASDLKCALDQADGAPIEKLPLDFARPVPLVRNIKPEISADPSCLSGSTLQTREPTAIPESGPAMKLKHHSSITESKPETSSYFNTVKLKQSFTDELKERVTSRIFPETSIACDDDDFVPVKDRVKIWEERHSPSGSREAERATLVRSDSGDASLTGRTVGVIREPSSQTVVDPSSEPLWLSTPRSQTECSLDSPVDRHGRQMENQGTRAK